MSADPRSQSHITRDFIILLASFALLAVVEFYTTGMLNDVLTFVVGGFFVYFAYIQLSYMVSIYDND